MTEQRRFTQMDVFTDTAFRGNPLAVIVDGLGLTTDEMQQVANWTNLSETVFLLPPTDPAADYLVRIFTPVAELDFAGHPTIGACSAWLQAGGVPASDGNIVQQCAAGLVELRRDGDRIAFAAPPRRRSGPVDEGVVVELAATLGVDRASIVECEWVDNGPGWVGVLLETDAEVLALTPRVSTTPIGVVAVQPAGSPEAIEVRAFFPLGDTMIEDPVTGSLNASLAQWLLGSGRVLAPYVARQGTVLGRAGRVHVSVADGETWVGGDTVTCITGTVTI
jgi:PhzF family phenazine biosynthesis protein